MALDLRAKLRISGIPIHTTRFSMSTPLVLRNVWKNVTIQLGVSRMPTTQHQVVASDFLMAPILTGTISKVGSAMFYQVYIIGSILQ